jgi:hypothetical protein
MAPSSAFTARHRRRTLLGVAVPRPVCRPTFSWFQTPTQLSAAAGPILSNGDAFDLHSTVDDAHAEYSQQVSYTLHARVGTWVTTEVYPSLLALQDTVQCHADEPPSTCSAATKVDTPTPQIPVAATDLVSVIGTVVSTACASSQSPPMLWLNVSG